MKRFLSLVLLIVVAASAARAQTNGALADIVLPDGFSIEVFTDEVPNARSLALGDAGTIFVSTRRDGRIYAVVPQSDTRPTVITIAEGLKTPNGIAFHDDDLYVAETTRLLRFSAIESKLDDLPEPEVLDESFPSERHHGWRYIGFGPDGKLYMSIGAPCNVCDKEGFGIIQRMDPDGGNKETVAYGVRNSVGLEFHPDSGDLWFTDNGRDMLGDDLPPGELNHAPTSGLHFGFPFCHGGDIADPEYGDRRSCDEFTAPAQKLGPHVAPLGLVFYDGEMFPESYRGQVFIAEHGSWNRSKKIGYRVTLVRMDGNTPLGYEVFAQGWLQDEEVSGRPVDLLLLDDGSMILSDDQAGRLYRIWYTLPLLDETTAD